MPKMVVTFVAMVLLPFCTGYPSFRYKLPNGMRVPCPPGAEGCSSAEGDDQPPSVCKGLGHTTCAGGTVALNPFGRDFKAAGYTWTAELCCKDSDGDGYTNGQELGDAECAYVGTQADSLSAAHSTDVSHPGFASGTTQAAPVTSTFCSTAAKGEVKEESSESVYLPDGQYFLEGEPQFSKEFIIAGYTIPSKRTTYIDIGWKADLGECYNCIYIDI
jgi:hypothetical protein